jgi:hypothetical protein
MSQPPVSSVQERYNQSVLERLLVQDRERERLERNARNFNSRFPNTQHHQPQQQQSQRNGNQTRNSIQSLLNIQSLNISQIMDDYVKVIQEYQYLVRQLILLNSISQLQTVSSQTQVPNQTQVPPARNTNQTRIPTRNASNYTFPSIINNGSPISERLFTTMAGNTMAGNVASSSSNGTQYNSSRRGETAPRTENPFEIFETINEVSNMASTATHQTQTQVPSRQPNINFVDLVVEVDENFEPFAQTVNGNMTAANTEQFIQNLFQNDDFRNSIMRSTGIAPSLSTRWFTSIVSADNREEEGLTQERIQECTERMEYEEGMEGLLSNTCPISMEDFHQGDILLKLRDCSHVFLEDHLLRWFQSHSTCPVCRRSYLAASSF